MKPDIKKHPYNTIVSTLLGRGTPEAIMDILAELNEFDYLDWEGFIEEREAELRVDHNFIPCNQCKIISNRQSWVSVGRATSGANHICADCARILRPDHSYTCAWCNASYLSMKPQKPDMDVCWRCTHVSEHVSRQLSRARLLDLPATLTIKEWKSTLKYFGEKCAYCYKRPYECLEHYIPLSLQGGTTADNCFPSCYRCNTRKRDKHPNEFVSLFSAENVARIKDYRNSLT